ncbi:MAG: CbrC family protein [Actinomycetaceae bacterium]|nr:CbrC family protein [Actinomycetaceae bacterium]
MTTAAPGARLEDIAACEAAIGARLPQWLKAELLKHNGWVRAKWKFLPVRNYETHRVEPQSIEGQTYEVRITGIEKVPGSIVVAWDTTKGYLRRLIATPSDDDPGVLGETLRIQEGDHPLSDDIFSYDDIVSGKRGLVARPEAVSSVDLPTFRYFPDPVFTGAIEGSDGENPCECCGEIRDWKYRSHVWYEDGEEREEANFVCPWCISSGRVQEQWGSEFTFEFDEADLEPTIESYEEVIHRTPGYFSWQEARWRAHCGEAMAFKGYVGWGDIKDNPSVCASVEHHADILDMMIPGGMINGLLFECLHCETQILSIDCG